MAKILSFLFLLITIASGFAKLDIELSEPFVVNGEEETVVESFHLQAITVDDMDNVTIDDTRTYYMREIPSHGFLMREGVLLNTAGLNKTFTQQDIYDGLITYQSVGGNITLDSFQFRFKNMDDTWTSDFSFSIQIIPTPAPPTISLLQNQSVPFGTEFVNQNFSIGDPDTALESLTLSVFSDNPVLVPDSNIELYGDGANWSVVVTPVEEMSGTAKITVTVSDGELEASAFFDFAVIPPPEAPTLEISYNTSTTNVNSFTLGEVIIIPFTVTDADTPINSVSVSALSDDFHLAPPSAITLTPIGNERLLIIEPPEEARGKTIVTLTATDGINDFSASTEVYVTTAPPGILSGLPETVTLYQDTSVSYPLVLQDPDPFEDMDSIKLRAVGNIHSNLFSVSFSGTGEERVMTIYRNTNDVNQIINGDFGIELADDGPFVESEKVHYILTTNSAAPSFPNLSAQATAINTPITIPIVIKDEDTPYEHLRLYGSAPGWSSNLFTVVNTGTQHLLTIQPPLGVEGNVNLTLIAYDGRFRSTNSFTLVITNFMSSDLTPFAGRYEGLIKNSYLDIHERFGFVDLKLKKNGVLFGKIHYGSTTKRLRGKLDGKGLFQIDLPNIKFSHLVGEPSTVSLQMGLAADGKIIGYASQEATMVAYRRSFDKANTWKLPRHYNALVKGIEDEYTSIFLTNSFSPLGLGYFNVAVNKRGVATIRGQTSDGVRFKQRVGVSSNYTIPLYVPTYRQTGSLVGELQLTSLSSNEVTLTTITNTTWSAPPGAAAIYSDSGFACSFIATGRNYEKDRVKLSTIEFSFLPGEEKYVYNLVRKGSLFQAEGFPAELRFNTRTGQLRGAFSHPYSGRPTQVYGTVIDEITAGGFFLQYNEETSGKFELK